MANTMNWTEPRRVEILFAGERPSYFKPGQFAYIIGTNLANGRRYNVHTMDSGETNGESFLVSKTKDMRGGALRFTPRALRLTARRRA